MLNKKHILILLLFIVAIGTVSSVSADTNATDEMSASDIDDEIAITEDSDEVAVDNTNEIIADEPDESNEDTNSTNVAEDANNTTEEEGNDYDSLISVKQSGKYLNDKTFTITLTDLNGNPLKNKEIWCDISSTNGKYFDLDTITTNSKGIATYKWDADFLPAGTYEASFHSWDTYSEEIKIGPFKVTKQSVKIKPTALTTVYNSGKTFQVKVVDSNNKPVKGVELRLKVYTGKKYKNKYVTTNAKGIASYKASTLSKGTHKIVISATNAKATAKNSKVVIKPRAITIKTKSYKINTADFAGGIVDIQVKDKSSKKGLNGVSLTLKIKNGKKYKTVKLVTGYDSDENKNGIAGILTNQYSVGTHKVIIKPTSKNYKGSATAKIVITKSAKKNYYNFHIYFTKGKIVSKVYY